MEQVQEQPQAATHALTIRDYVDMALIFGCLPALILNVLFWAIATAFGSVGVLSSILALLITLLLALVGLILIVHYVDVMVLNWRKHNTTPGFDEESLMRALGGGIVWIFCATCIVGCLSVAGSLEGWHYTLMAGEVLLVGYQTWRVFLGRQQ